MDQTKFRNMVLDDLHGRALQETRDMLRLPEWVEAWYDELGQFLREIDVDIAQRKADLNSLHCKLSGRRWKGKDRQEYFKAKADFDQWKIAVVKMKMLGEKKASEAKKLKHEQHEIREAKRQATREPKVKESHGKFVDPELIHLVKWAQRLIPNAGDGAAWHAEYAQVFW